VALSFVTFDCRGQFCGLAAPVLAYGDLKLCLRALSSLASREVQQVRLHSGWGFVTTVRMRLDEDVSATARWSTPILPRLQRSSRSIFRVKAFNNFKQGGDEAAQLSLGLAMHIAD